jgi:hypothetical protein
MHGELNLMSLGSSTASYLLSFGSCPEHVPDIDYVLFVKSKDATEELLLTKGTKRPCNLTSGTSSWTGAEMICDTEKRYHWFAPSKTVRYQEVVVVSAER